MATITYRSTTLSGRLCRGFSIALVAAAALYALAPTPAQATPKGKAIRPPIIRPPVRIPPRTGVDGAHGYVAPLAEERERARWAKLYKELTENPPVRNKKTGKWSFKNTNETFHSRTVAEQSLKIMRAVTSCLKDGDVKEAKMLWRVYNANSDTRWNGRTRGRKNRELNYGTDKAGKAKAKADEAAQRNVIDSMWHDVKKAEAKGLKPVKASAPAK